MTPANDNPANDNARLQRTRKPRARAAARKPKVAAVEAVASAEPAAPVVAAAAPAVIDTDTTRHWREALLRALADNDRAALNAIAGKVVELAREGDMRAIKEIADSLDDTGAGKGKADSEAGPARLVLSWMN